MSHVPRACDRRRMAAALLAIAVAAPPLGGLGGSGTVYAADGPPGAWLPSPDLVVGEVVTGGASGSDEWIEIHDRGGLAADLGGLELVYVTATGGTITRKASWEAKVVKPGTSLLLANEAGAFASLAEGTWTGGLSAAGGTLVLRVTGGEVVDTLSWGTAATAWVEGRPGLAPPAGSSLERLPDGADLNGRDTNDNRDDTWIQAQPIPDARRADPTPEPTPEPTEAPTPEPTAAPTPEPTAAPTPEPTAAPTLAPTPEPTAAPTPEPTAAPTPAPTPEPTEAPTTAIAAAKDLPVGTVVTIRGVLTTPLGFTDAGRGAYLQDASGGIAIYLATADWPAVPGGHVITAHGSFTSRYGQATLALASAADLVDAGAGIAPDPVGMTNEPSETLEGRLVTVAGTIAGSPDELADGPAADLTTDGGTLRLIAANGSGIPASSLSSGRRVVVTGVLGQRASTAAGTNGYRVWLRSAADIVDRAGPSPAPSPTPSPTLAPSPSPTPVPTASPTYAPTPTSTPTPRPTTTPRPTATPAIEPVVSIGAARGMPIGERVAVEGTVTVPVGRLLGPAMTFLQDGTGGLAVRLPNGFDVNSIQPGVILQVSGGLANPYANLELRVAAPADVVLLGRGGVPNPVTLTSVGLTETREGELARISGIVERVESGSSGSLAISIRDNGGEARIFAFGAAGINRGRFASGSRLTATGIVGQRESASGVGDGYRLWPRGPADLVLEAAPPTARPGATPAPRPTPTGRPGSGDPSRETVRIGSVREGTTVTVQGTITTPVGLLDGESRRVIIADSSGAILVRFPDGASVPPVGTRIRAAGEVGTWFGGLQLATTDVPRTLGRTSARPVVLRRAPGAADEWRLVRLTVRITDLARSGATWRAEASLGAGGSLPIVGVAGAEIPSTALGEGRSATITGIVRRAYPTATDQRFGLVPRSVRDIELGRDPGSVGDVPDSGGEAPGEDASADPSADPAIATGEVIDTTLDALTRLAGRHVRVSGALRQVDSALLTIDDGSATALVRLLDREATFQPPLAPGEVLNVTGTVAERDVGGWEVVARSESVVRAASLALPTLAPRTPVPAASPRGPEPSTPVGGPTPSTADDPGAAAGDLWQVMFALVVGLTAAAVVIGGGLLASRRFRHRPNRTASMAASATTSSDPDEHTSLTPHA